MSHTPRRSGPVVVSGQPPGSSAEPDALGTDEGDRYRDGGLLGRGGVGEVRSVRDRRLERDVARKMLLADDLAAAARLGREARITARLEHPGIVPVYDAGCDEHGRPWYTMRVIRGRNLADALTGAPDPAHRAALLRHFLDACEAVAFAHSVGVVHRDLKPANILLGPFGETQVADWGLALEVARADEVHHDVGTPAYMSPEQERGEAATPASDVYALGAVLYEILAGASLWDTRRPDVLAVRPDAPRELAAVVRRALQPAPDQRYPTAAELARDLSQWFDGRRVSAHEYSPWELMTRAVRAWRVPLSVALAAALVGVGAAGLAWARTSRERDRAQAAEAETSEALARADRTLALLQVERAHEALLQGDRPTSERLAAQALLAGEDPGARGILAAWATSARPWRQRFAALGPCDRVVASDDGQITACLGTEQTVVHGLAEPLTLSGRVVSVGWTGRELVVARADRGVQWVDASGAVRATLSGAPALQHVRPIPGDDRVILLGNSHWALADPERGLTPMRPCPVGIPEAVAFEGDRPFTLCDRGAVATGSVSEPGVRVLMDVPEVRGQVMAYSTGRFVAGTLRGALIAFDASGAVQHRHEVSDTPIQDLSLDPSGRRAAFTDSAGVTSIVDLASGAALATLPGRSRSVRWLDDTTVRRAAAGLEDWVVPPSLRPVRHRTSEGVSALDLSDDGRTLAAALGDGHLVRWDLGTGRALPPARWQDLVVKSVDFAPGSGRMVASAGQEALAIVEPDGQVSRRVDTRPLRRVMWTERGLLGVPYAGGGVLRWPDLGAPWVVTDAGRWVDLDATDAGEAALLGRPDGTVARLGPTGEPVVLAELPGATDIAVSPDRVAVVTPQHVVVLDWTGAEIARLAGGGEPEELAIDETGTRVALGSTQGRLTVWDVDSGEVLMRSRAHGGRVSALVFAEDLLASGSWDRTVRLWGLGVLERPAEELHGEITAAWGVE